MNREELMKMINNLKNCDSSLARYSVEEIFNAVKDDLLDKEDDDNGKVGSVAQAYATFLPSVASVPTTCVADFLSIPSDDFASSVSIIGSRTDATYSPPQKSEPVVMKYKLGDKENGMWRIVACKDTPFAKKGELGGLVQSENNLSQDGDCWIDKDACVCEDAVVSGNAYVGGNAYVAGNAEISGRAKVLDEATVCDNAKVYGRATVKGNARVLGNSQVYGCATVRGKAEIRGKSEVYDHAVVEDEALVDDFAEVYDYAILRGKATAKGRTEVFSHEILDGEDKEEENKKDTEEIDDALDAIDEIADNILQETWDNQHILKW